MLTGLPTFFSENVNLMYKKILFAELTFPPSVSDNAQHLLRGLLHRDPSQRLGSGSTDADEIKRHMFFSDMTWEKLVKKMIPAPFKPTVVSVPSSLLFQSCLSVFNTLNPPLIFFLLSQESEHDVQNFDPQFTEEMPVDSPPNHAPLTDSMQEHFKGFTYIKEGELGKGKSLSPTTIQST